LEDLNIILNENNIDQYFGYYFNYFIKFMIFLLSLSMKMYFLSFILAELESKINNLISFKIKAKGSSHKMTEGLLLKEIPIKEHEKNKPNVK